MSSRIQRLSIISMIARKIEKTYPFITQKLREMSIQLQEEQKNGQEF